MYFELEQLSGEEEQDWQPAADYPYSRDLRPYHNQDSRQGRFLPYGFI